MPKIEVVLSPQFDICYALADLVSPSPASALFDKHPSRSDWRREAIGLGWAFWLAMPDILGARRPAADIEQMIEAVRSIGIDTAWSRLRHGLYHAAEEGSREEAEKREWLAFVGLEGDADANPVRAALRSEGAATIAAAIDVLQRFRPIFEAKWVEHRPTLERSADRAARLAQGADFSTIAETLKLKVEVDEGRQRLRALRGGYEIDLRKIGTIYLLPSLVNYRGFWTVADDAEPATAFFPFVDPEHPPVPARKELLDPWLVCRALGDPTRAAIIRRLNEAPMTSSDLMRELGLSKANISHHIFQLREAQLVDEEPRGRSILLSLRRSTLDGLSSALRRSLPAPARRRTPQRAR